MFEMFMKLMQPGPSSSVLDLGVTPDQSLPESNFFERSYPFKDKIVAASIEDASFLEKEYPGLQFVRLQKGPLPFSDDQFDFLVCSAVLEHVGNREAQRAFIKEALRVCRHFYFNTPDRRFPIEVHTFLPFLHWFPQPVHQAILNLLGKGFWAKTDNLNLLSPRTFMDLFPPCGSLQALDFRLFSWPSNIVVYGNK